MKRIILICTYLFIIKFSLFADHQATNILATIYPTNQIVGTFADFRYYLRINDMTNAKVDTFIIHNPYTNYHINNVSSVTVDSTNQWLMNSSTRPGPGNFFSWYYDDGKLILLSSQSAVTSGQTVIIHFQQNLPTTTGTNFQYHAQYSNSEFADGITNSCTEFSNGWKVDLLPGDLDKFQMKGYPTVCTAGVKWNNTSFVTAIAYDMYDNIKTDFTNSIYFRTTSPLHQLKFSNNQTSFTCTNNGICTINGSNFMLNSVGNQYLIVTNETFEVSEKSDAIEVVAGGVSGFLSSISVETGIAGTLFYLKVTGATDSYGNDITGTAEVSITNTDISDYTINDIAVNNNTGSNQQVIREATINKVTFKIKMGSYSNYASLSNVLPADDVGSLQLISSVSKVTAGEYINKDVTVRIYDIYDNLKINATNSIWFTNTAGDGIFTNDSGNKYQFGSTGEHVFSMTNFTYTSAGIRDLIVTNQQWGVSDKISGIEVVAGDVDGFLSSISVETGIAGTLFYLKVTGATDSYGNDITGTAEVSITNTDISDYTINDIAVNNNTGSNQQVIREATINKVTFKIKMGSYSNYASLSNVLPADDVGSLQLISSVSKVTAGEYINKDVTVRIYDIYDNLKINATNSIWFTNTAGDGIFTNDSGNKYQFGSTGEHVFSITNFTYTSAGIRDLIVTNQQWGVSDRISGIEVVAGDVDGFLSSVSVETGIAGTSFYLKVTGATDSYGNDITGTAEVSITNTDISDYTINDIAVNNNTGSNQQVIREATINKVTFKIKMGSYSNYASLSNVLPADDVGSLQLISSVSKVTAGEYINEDVTVRIYDIYDNLKINATNSIWFTNTAGDGIFTNDSGNKYQFGSTGEHVFSMTNFTYTSAGIRDLIVTNQQWGVSDKISGIEVVAGDVDGFLSSVSVETGIAGTLFYLKVTGATDSYGNDITGTAEVSITNTDISDYTINDIAVNNNTGSNQQVIREATINKVTFKIKMGSYSNYASLSNVRPANEVGSLQLISSVSKVTAGEYINKDVTVRIYDIYDNLKINATNSIWFTNTAGDGIFTNDNGNKYQFGSTGEHVFSMTNFTYTSAGIRDLIVTNEQWGVSDRISGIEVVAGDVDGFLSSVSVETGIAGTLFYLKVTGATDSYGNDITGTAEVSITNTDISDYTINDIAVNNNTGSNQQVIREATINKVTFKIKMGSYSNYASLSNVLPADDVGSLQLISSVSKVTAGEYINKDVTVRIYDIYDNLKINATNSIWFTNTAGDGIFTNDSGNKYQFGSTGEHVFSMTNFTYTSAGIRDLIVTNQQWGVSDKISGIEVVAGDVDGFLSSVSVETGIAGTLFYLKVTGATDSYGNDITGTAEVSITNTDISDYTINDIAVNNNTGSNQQVIREATINKVTFKIKMGSYSNYASLSNVRPANEVGSLQLISSVSKVTAGEYINKDVTVRIYDIYDNLKINATNSIWFTNTAGDGIFTNDSGNKYQFGSTGEHVFSMTNFTYTSAGIRDLIVTNQQWGVSDKISGIEVVAGDVSGFLSSISVETGIAGTSFYLKVTGATDSYGNDITGTAEVSITNTDISDYTINDIAVNNNTGSNQQVIREATINKVTFKIKMGSYSNYASLSNVRPADDVGSLQLISSVSKVTAGEYINKDVTVRIYDIYDNLKINATNSIWFTNTAGDGIFTNDSGNKYQFGSTGEHVFSITNFTYTSAGIRDLIVTNQQWGVSDRISGIEVVAGDVDGFLSSVSVETGIAGTSFYLKVTGATDSYGNDITGTAEVSITNTDISDYTINDIAVNNNTGSNQQVIREATINKVTFKIKMGSYSNYASLSNVLPADDVGSLQLISSVSKVTAGEYINEDVTVRIYDIYDNLKINATNSIWFTNTAGDGIFTNDSGNKYQFGSTGEHVFSMTNFTYTSAGIRDLIVTNQQWGVSDKISGIEVVAGDVDGFLSSISVETGIAGTLFYLKVTGATDSYGNDITGTAEVSITNTDISDYTINDIAVNNNTGSNQQVIREATINKVTFKIKMGSYSNYASLSNVLPADDVGSLQLISSVSKVTAGEYINKDVTVRIYDIYDNLKINATNSIWFTNTAGDGIFTNDSGNKYQFGSTGEHVFSMTNFTYTSAGIRDLIVTNQQWGVSDRISGIEVVAGDVDGFLSSVSVETGIAGTSFYLKVTGATDSYGNDITGTAEVSITNTDISDYTINDIAVNNNTGSNQQVIREATINKVTFKIKMGSYSNYASLSNVLPADDVGSLQLISSVSKVTAGEYINKDVTVRIYDIYDNLKINATNSIWFTNTAGDGIFTNDSGNKYQFGSTGEHVFSITNFTYTSAGIRDLIVTNQQWGVSDKISGIEVVAGDVDGFLSSVSVETGIAGTLFYLKVTGATDSYGNDITGTAEVSITNTDISDYTINDIAVNNNTGSNQQVIRDATTSKVVFKIKMGSYSNYASLSNVRPANEVGSLQLISSVSKVTAGEYINKDVTVRIYDIYDNLKINATNSIWFTNTAGDGIFTNDNGNKYQFGSTGEHVFSMTNFTYTSAGIRDLIVTNEQWGVSDRISGIEVVAGDVDGFLSSVSVETGIAGTLFYLKVTGATDSYGNDITGTAEVSITNTDISDYTINDIAVNNNTGSNQQVIREATINKVTFKIKMGSYSNYASLSNVLPADDVGSLQLISSVSKVTAGEYINKDVTVRIYDIYDNLKINATNSIWFTNTAGDGIFTNDSGNKYQFGSTGEHVFSMTNFTYTSAGIRDLIVTNQQWGVSDKISGIEVVAGDVDGFLLNTSIETAKVGRPFYIIVTGATDSYGNTVSDTAYVNITNSTSVIQAPDSNMPNESDIAVINGIGSNLQMLVKATTDDIVFRVVLGGKTNYHAITNTYAGDLNSLGIMSSVSKVTAGQHINENVTVSLYDSYLNIAARSTNKVYFLSSDTSAIFTNDSSKPYTFTLGDGGVNKFTNTYFKYNTIGIQNLIVTNTNKKISACKEGIEVVGSGNVSGFFISGNTECTCGKPFMLNITDATDSYGNDISGTAYISITNSTEQQAPDGSMPILNNILVTLGNGYANQILVRATTNDIVFRVGLGGITNYHTVSNTYAGDLNSLGIMSSISKVTAGQYINQDVTVTLYDNYLNIATRSTNEVYFLSSDTSAIFTNGTNKPYPFKSSDAGVKVFPKTNFMYMTVGIQNLIVTNTNNRISAIKLGINVVSGGLISGFSLSGVTDATCGKAFMLNITGATDIFGYPISGITATVEITNDILIRRAPDNSLPSVNDIVVLNGNGYSFQTLVRATTDDIVFRVVLEGKTNYHTITNTYAGDLNSLGIMSSVSKVTAGQHINQDVTVTLYDSYLNIATRSTNEIYFLSSDTSAIFTNGTNKPYPFTLSDAGVGVFPKSNFMYMTVGIQNLIVTNTNYKISAVKSGIEVVAGEVDGFLSSVSIETGIAGTSFYVKVTGATDSWGNDITGTAEVSITNTDISDYTINDIAVNNGIGSNQQVIRDATTNKVVFKIKMGSYSNYASLSNVLPADKVGSLQLISSVSKVTAGQYINKDVTVRIYDIYNNLKINATNSIWFTNTVGDGIFTNDNGNKYQFASTGEHVFSMTNFTYTGAGIRDLIVTNEQWEVSDRISGIEVVAGDVDGFLSSVSVETGIAGTLFYLKVTGATDSYGNDITGTAEVSITNTDISDYTINDIAVNNNTGSNQQVIRDATTSKVVFKIKMGSYSNYASLSNVLPSNEVGSLQLISSVSKVTAGEYINQPVTVRIYDIYDNLKINATNSIWFTNTAGDGIFTNDSGNKYQFGSTGEHVFSMTNFTYTSAGIRDLIVTNEQWGVSDRIGGIEVVAGDVDGFLSSISIETGIAGTLFYLKVTGATDSYGNGITGTAEVSITNTDISDYTINDIAVNNRIGSNQQVIRDATTSKVVFKIKMGSYSNYASLSNVLPSNEVGSLQLISSVSKVTAGEYINQPVTVRIYDIYDNLKINATNSVWFTNTAGDGIFTNDNANKYQFTSTSEHVFSMTNFTYTKAGIKDLIVTNQQWGVSDRISGIEVIAGGVDGFLSSVSVETGIAGTSFYIKVTGATDSYGNDITGTAEVSITNTDISDYTINDIAVNNRIGSNQQVIRDATTNKVVFKIKMGSYSNYASLSNVLPSNEVGSLQLISSVSKVTAGEYINQPVTVRIYDIYDNLKINATNSVWFTNTAGDGIFTNRRGNAYQFTNTDKGEHEFSWTNFTYTKAGIKDLIVTNEQWGVSDRIGGIEVIATIPIDFTFNISSITQQAGVGFLLNVSDVTDAYGNLCDGTIVITNLTPNINAPSGATPTYNNIIFNNGTGNNSQILVKATNTVLKGTIQNTSITDIISINVFPDMEDKFELLGYQTQCTSGIRWMTQTIVTMIVYDQFDNIKFDYTNSVYFTSSDPNAILPYTNTSPYDFVLSDNGVKTFQGTNFTLNTGGNQTITITDGGSISETSSFIYVYGSGISSFSLTLTSYTQKAGIGFLVKVTNALDGSSNPANGTVRITNIGAPIISPSGSPPTFNEIIVNNGTGQNSQTIFKTTNVVLKGILVEDNTITNMTSQITINPADVNQINFLGGATICTAGIRWNNQSSVTVKAYDLYENLKFDYTNSIYFASTDSDAILPYTNGNPYDFQLSDNGIKVFDGTNFTLKKAGNQTISIIDNNTGLFDDSGNILVHPNFVTSFDISLDNYTQMAGIPFIINITNALDDYGNLANAVLNVTNLSGGGPSPGGDYPVFNNINIFNGIGSAQQTLYNAVDTVLIISNIDNGITNTTSIKVAPSFASGNINIIPVPQEIVANGSDISFITSSTIRDTYSNKVTNGTIGTITTTKGIITNADLSLATPGTQISIENGVMQFGLQSSTVPGVAIVSVSAGAASGSTNVLFKGITLVQVSSPVGTVSKGQNNVPVNFWINNTSSSTLKNASIGLTLGTGFSGIGPTNTIILPNTTMTMQFMVSISSNASSGAHTLDGYVSGTLDGNNVSYTGASATGSWLVQNPGQLFARFVNVPGQVVVDYNFAIEVSVKNIGEATITNINLTNFQISSTNAVYFFNPTNYSPKNLTLLAGESNSFLFNFTASGNTTDMYFYARPMGIERNTGIKKSYPLAYSGTIDVTTLAEVKLQLTKENLSPVTVFKGQQDVVMLKMSLYNPLGTGAVNIVEVRQIQFDALDYTGSALNPATAINKIRIYDDSQTYLETSNIPQNNHLYLNFTQVMNVHPSTTKDFYISIDISPGASAETFALNIGDSSYIRANIISFTNSVIQEIVDGQGNKIYNVKSDYVVIKGNTFDDVKGNYPNPFNAGGECTAIEYYLKTEGTVTIKIYTLTGYLVRTLIENERRDAGVQSEEWCGENDSSSIVRNGIYLAVIKAKCQDKTYEGVIKIAVVK